jgi:hypothetical protein
MATQQSPSAPRRHHDVVLSEVEARLPQSPFARLRAMARDSRGKFGWRLARELALRQAQGDSGLPSAAAAMLYFPAAGFVALIVAVKNASRRFLRG